MKLFKHNRKYPDKKLSPLYLKPPEYIEDDELFQQATGLGDKESVYIFFISHTNSSSIIPCIANWEDVDGYWVIVIGIHAKLNLLLGN